MLHHEGTKDTKVTKAAALELSHEIIGAAIEVHRVLGPGLLESVYEKALTKELWLIVEVKSVEKIINVYRAQLLTYLRLRELWLGLLINFNAETLREGVRRILNG
jgi:hypothetical protein